MDHPHVHHDAPLAGASTSALVREMHICPRCARDFVYPTDWHEISMTHWEVELRCPNCEWSAVGLYDQATVDRFDVALDRGSDLLIRDLQRITRDNMRDAARRFLAALAADAVWPMDF